MSSLKRWRRIGQGQFHRWQTPGDAVQGLWRALGDGGVGLPSVTSILEIIAKPGLAPWYAKQERQFFETAMLDVLSRPGARDPEIVLAAVADAVTGIKAADREKQKAGIIGTAVHAGIEWYLRTQLGEDAGPEPRLPDAAMWALESWKDWAKR